MFYHIYIYIYISSRDSLPFFLYHDWAWKDTEAKIVRQVFLDQTFPSVTPFLSIYSYCTYPRPKNWNSRFHFIPSLVNVTRGIISNLVNFCTYFPRISRIRILTTHRKFHKDGEKKKRKGKKLKSPRYEESWSGCVHPLCDRSRILEEDDPLLFSSTILIVLVLMKSVTVKGGWRAMHHRHVGGCRGRRGRRRIRCWRQQRRTLKTNDQWQRGRGAQAHRVSSTLRHWTMPRPCWPRKRFFFQVHALKKSNKPVERSVYRAFIAYNTGAGKRAMGFNTSYYLFFSNLLPPLLLLSRIFLPRFVFLS